MLLLLLYLSMQGEETPNVVRKRGMLVKEGVSIEEGKVGVLSSVCLMHVTCCFCLACGRGLHKTVQLAGSIEPKAKGFLT
jgi:hypothetical protein